MQTNKRISVLVSFILFFFSAQSQNWQPLGHDDFNEPAFNSSTSTSIAIDAGGHPYIACRDQYTGLGHVRKFNGISWEEVGDIASSFSAVQNVYLLFDAAGNPTVLYADPANNRPIVKKYINGSWVEQGPGLPAMSLGDQTIAMDANGNLIVAYPDLAIGRKLNLSYNWNGNDWFPLAGTTGFTPAAVASVSMASDGGDYVYTAFSDAGNSGAVTVARLGINTGFSLVGNAGFSPGAVSFTAIALDAAHMPYVAYADGANGNRISVKKFDGTSWSDVGTPGFSIGVARDIGLKINGGNMYVVYADAGNSNKTVVKKFDGNNWVDAGFEISTGGDSRQRLAVDASGTPYVMYVHASFGIKAIVKKLTGSTWTTVGGQGIAEGSARIPKLASGSNGVPYIAYMDFEEKKVVVKKYDGNNWVTTPVVSTGMSSLPAITVGSDNIPWIFYADQTGNTIKKLIGNNWINVGAPAFTGGMSSNVIAVDAAGTPYVAYKDLVSTKINVQKYDGTNWVYVGQAGFSTGAADNIALLLDAGGTPYVTYSDAGNGSKATVKKFDGIDWVDVGTPGISTGSSRSNCLAMDGNGTLYASYYETAEVRVKKFDGANWVDVGFVGSGGSISTALGVDRNNVLYVAFTYTFSSWAGLNIRVKKFDGADWVDVGAPGLIAGKAGNELAFTFGGGDVPVVAYINGGIYAKSLGPIVILPLRLTEFNGRINNIDARLSWKTDNEVNTHEFVIERSTDGRSYFTAGTVPAINESGAHQYAFIDKGIDHLGASPVYYRLKQVDMDGKSNYSRVLVLPVAQSGNRVTCFPNPVTSETNVTVTIGKAEKVQARIINSMGQVMQVQQRNLSAGTSSFPVNMSRMPNGLYYLEISSQSIKKQIGLVKQ
jgi:hypothetical protein